MKIDLKKIRELGNLELLARQLVEGFITGLHKSPYHGFSVEFAEHRIVVGVAQLVEPRVVIPVVVGSSPIVHPSLGR